MMLPMGLMLTVLFAAGCSQAKYVHAVFFTCKADTPPAAIDALVADGQLLLSEVPSVCAIQTGRRDTQADRDVNVKDYDVGLVVYFKDKEGLEEYIEHPKHVEYVEKNKDLWAQVRVYDFIAR
jgi:hypothetical protein